MGEGGRRDTNRADRSAGHSPSGPPDLLGATGPAAASVAGRKRHTPGEMGVQVLRRAYSMRSTAKSWISAGRCGPAARSTGPWWPASAGVRAVPQRGGLGEVRRWCGGSRGCAAVRAPPLRVSASPWRGKPGSAAAWGPARASRRSAKPSPIVGLHLAARRLRIESPRRGSGRKGAGHPSSEGRSAVARWRRAERGRAPGAGALERGAGQR
jgi:hypothetical protein